MILNEAGRTIQRVWEDLPQRFLTVVLDVFQLMPNHLHGILVIPCAGLEPALVLATGAQIIQPSPKARVRQAVPLRWPGLSERSNPLRPLRSIASNLVLEGVCCNRISTNISFAASTPWKRFALTLGRTRCVGLKILKIRIDRQETGLRPSGVRCRGRACPTPSAVAHSEIR